jgi:AAA+ superfamily predicted ATPase
MNEFIGTHNTLTQLIEQKAEIQPDPSLPQVRNLVAEYVGIPLGSDFAKQKLEKWNWFLFYGPMGTGKTLLTRALQNETRALLFDLSPNNVKREYTEKAELTKLTWSVIICAKHFQPAIVLVEDFETIFPGKVKAKKKPGMAVVSFGPKMKKPIKDIKKNRLWENTDKVAVIGCTNKPYEGSMKYFRKLFDKQIYFPYPNYSSRKLMLQTFIERKVGRPLTNFSYSTLAHTTEGFTANSVHIR